MKLAVPAPPPTLLPLAGDPSTAFPVRRVYAVGRNYAEHAREMGFDPDREPPFFFQKNPDDLDTSGELFYPPMTEVLHHEVELLVALKAGGRNLSAADASQCVFGYAVALDLTRRDLQAQAKKAGRPWEAAKAAERSAPCSALTPAADAGDLSGAAIWLAVNGEERQRGSIGQMIWSVPEVIAELSKLFALAPGDVVLTGTPAGVGPLQPGDEVRAGIDGVGRLDLTVTPPLSGRAPR